MRICSLFYSDYTFFRAHMQTTTVQKEENPNLLLVVENVSPTGARKSSEHKYSTIEFLLFLAHFNTCVATHWSVYFFKLFLQLFSLLFRSVLWFIHTGCHRDRGRTGNRTGTNGLHDFMQNTSYCTWTGTGKNGLHAYFSGPKTVSDGVF